MEPSPEPRETISRFEKLLAALVTSRVDFAVVGGLAVIFGSLEAGSARIPYLLPADLIFLGVLSSGAGKGLRPFEISTSD
jgi:hypothetical protein